MQLAEFQNMFFISVSVLLFLLFNLDVTFAQANSPDIFRDLRRRQGSSRSPSGRIRYDSVGMTAFASRIARLESAVAVHHSDVDRQLETITSYLASRDLSCGQLERTLVQLVSPMSAKLDSILQELRNEKAFRQTEAAHIRELTSTVRGQSRLLMTVSSQPITDRSQTQQQREEIAANFDAIRGDIFNLGVSLQMQERDLVEKVNEAHHDIQLSLNELDKPPASDNNIIEEMSEITRSLGLLQNQSDTSSKLLLQEIDANRLALRALGQDVTQIQVDLSLLADNNSNMRSTLEDLKVQSSENITLLVETVNSDHLARSEAIAVNHNNTEALLNTLMQQSVSKKNLGALNNQLEKISTQINRTVEDVFTVQGVIQHKLDGLQTVQTSIQDDMSEISTELFNLTQIKCHRMESRCVDTEDFPKMNAVTSSSLDSYAPTPEIINNETTALVAPTPDVTTLAPSTTFSTKMRPTTVRGYISTKVPAMPEAATNELPTMADPTQVDDLSARMTTEVPTTHEQSTVGVSVARGSTTVNVPTTQESTTTGPPPTQEPTTSDVPTTQELTTAEVPTTHMPITAHVSITREPTTLTVPAARGSTTEAGVPSNGESTTAAFSTTQTTEATVSRESTTPEAPTTTTTQKPTTTTGTTTTTTEKPTTGTTTETTTVLTTKKPISFLDALLESLRKQQEARLLKAKLKTTP